MEYYHSEIGIIKINRRKNQKRLIVKYLPFKHVECSVPNYISYKKALKFTENNISWIKKQELRFLEKFDEFVRNGKIDLINNSIRIISHSEKFEIEYEKNTKEFTLKIPYFNPSDNPKLFTDFIELINEIVKIEAKSYLPKRISYLANLHGFSFLQLRIKNIKTRWGSCSYTNNINLNAHLVRLPSHLIDYVIIHELVHTVHKNHSEKFWMELNNKMNGNAYALDAEINRYHTSIFF